MFADDTNLFFTHKDIKYLFQIVNQELENINQWFISNKLSLKYSFFHKPSKYNENKIANLGLFFKAKPYPNKRSLLVLYYSFIHTYINYGKIAWRITDRTNL